MDTSLYNSILNYLKNNQLPVEVTEEDKSKILKYSKHYIVQNNLLYKQKNNQTLKVVKDLEVESLLFMLHNHPLGGHLGVEKVISKLKLKYYWPQYVDYVKDYIKSCDQYQKRGKNLRSGELRPIPVGKPFEM